MSALVSNDRFVRPSAVPARLRLRLGVVPALVLALAAGCGQDEGADTEPAPSPEAAAPAAAAADWELWAMDQGTHVVHIFDAELEEIDRIDLGAHGARVPHMIEFTPDQRFAFIANPASGNVAIVRAEDREVVALLETGPRTHHAGVAPDGRSALVSVIGSPAEPWDGKLVEILIHGDGEHFEMGRELVIAEDPLFRERQDEFVETGGAICLGFTADGRHGYVTLGPELEEGGAVVLDLETWRLVRVYAPGEMDVNCGTVLTPSEERMILVGGGSETGVYHAVDVASHEHVHRGETRGHDAHGTWFTPDGRELWIVNRVTSNAVIVDPESLEVIHEIPFVGKTPDIIAMSPEGDWAFVTLRGPNPVTMAHVAVGETPGVAVIDIATREKVRLLEPAAGDEASDFHGIAVRRLGSP